MKNEEFKSVGIRLSEEELNAVAGGYANNKILIYKAQPGDTLAFIATRFGTTTEAICWLNPGLTDSTFRDYGSILIPAKS